MSSLSERVLSILKAWGAHATSFQVLEPGYTYWFDDSVKAPGAFVAYVRSGSYRVAAGAPTAPHDALGAVAARFIDDAKSHGEKVIFFSVDGAFLSALNDLEEPPAVDSVSVGSLPEWDPRLYHVDGGGRATVRAQINRARNKGVRVRAVGVEELANAPGPLRAEIESVLSRWLDDRRMSVMRFLVDLQPFLHPEERRYYVAERDDRAVGFLAAIPVFARSGWFFEDVIRAPDAPNGTADLLVHSAMSDARARGEEYVTLGLAPLADIPAEPGPHPFIRKILSWSYSRLGPFYHFAGVQAFKARFHPDRWVPQYLVQSPPSLGPGTFHAVMRAFAGQGLLAFALETSQRWLQRIRSGVWAAWLCTLAACLVPWTLLLSQVDGAMWFGDASIQTGWVVFDTWMIVALLTLAFLVTRGHWLARPAAICLSGGTLTDLVLTTAQAMHLHHDVEGWPRLFVMAGILGPALATIFLGLLSVALARR